MTMQIPQFFGDPIQNATNAAQLQLANYRNVLAQQAMRDEQEKRAGYGAAYRNWTQPQQAPQPTNALAPETVQPTEALAKAGYGEFQYQPEQPALQQGQQSPQQPQPYTAPEGSSYNYMQGAQEANALFQKQQVDYYNQAIAPLMQTFLSEGLNDQKDKLIASLMASDNPMAGFAKQQASYLSDVNFASPGHVKDIAMTDNLRGMLSGATPAVQTAIDSVPNGQRVEAKFDRSGKVTEIISPKPIATGTQVIKRMVGGEPHNILIDRVSGADIQDLGLAPAAGSGNSALRPVDEGAAQAYAKAIREGRQVMSAVPSFRGMRDRVTYLLENPDVTTNPDAKPISYVGDIAESKASSTSLSFITKQLDMTESFIKTIDNNIDQFKNHITDMATRHNVDRGRLMNMGVRTYLKKFEGDADVNIYDMLVNAISTENAKLQAGGAGSVAQVAEGARTEMEKVHDKDMPIKEMLKLMEATRKEGDNRYKAMKDQHTKAGERTRKVTGSDTIDPLLIKSMTKEIKTKLADKKVSAGDTVKFTWNGKKYSVVAGANGSFSNWKYVKE